MIKNLCALALLAFASLACAQTGAGKKELVAKVLQSQRAAIEQTAQTLVEQPAAQLIQKAGVALQVRVAPDKREAVAKELQADLKKYLDEAVPLVRERALRLAPSTVGVLLEEKFSEDELRQLLAIIESPVNRKFLQLGAEMQQALVDKVVADAQAVIDPKIRALELSMSKRLGLPTAAAPAAGSANPAARAASK